MRDGYSTGALDRSQERAPFAALHEAARAEDRTGELSRSVAILREMGWFVDALPGAVGGADVGRGGRKAKDSVDRFIALSEANLPLARIFEGHVNAIALVMLYADPAVRQMLADAVGAGAVVGVWGADGDPPLTYDRPSRRLMGTKRYASGLSVLTHALVTLPGADGPQLALADVSDPGRADPSRWAMAGMRATASGVFDFSGMGHDQVAFVGEPGVYHREPHFLGGVWRIAALTLGGTFALLEGARSVLAERQRLDHPHQIARLGPLIWRALALRESLVRAAAFVEGPEGVAHPDRAAAIAIAARLQSEELGLAAVVAVERSLGLPHFDDRADTQRIARDLSTYMRQASGDALQERAGAAALTFPGRLADIVP